MKSTVCACAALGLLLALTFVLQGPGLRGAEDSPAASKSTEHGPRYTSGGELLYPEGFEDWIFVGSNLGLEYKEDNAPAPTNTKQPEQLRNFHNVYIDPLALAHFKKSGEFPDGTMLVLDVYRAERGDGKTLVAEGLFPGERSEVAVAVKNSARPDGSKTNWAYYDFPPGVKSAKAFADKACYQCHLDHGSVDNVFVQFYPVLRKYVAKKK